MMRLVLTGLLAAAVAWTAPRLLGTTARPTSSAWCAAAGTTAALAIALLADRAEPARGQRQITSTTTTKPVKATNCRFDRLHLVG